MSRPFILGLTGSIGMGKSTVADMFERRGVPVFDADAEVRRMQGPGGELIDEIERAFPGTAAGRRGVDRAKLAAAVFGDPAALARLEAIVHPVVRATRTAFLAEHAGQPLVVFDIPLLFEGAGERRVDATLVVSAPAFLQRHRVMARPGMSAERFGGILLQQVPDAQKRRKATIVIPTGLGLAPTRLALARAITKLKKRRGRFWPPNPWRERFTAQLARARRK